MANCILRHQSATNCVISGRKAISRALGCRVNVLFPRKREPRPRKGSRGDNAGFRVISDTDRELLALALDLEAILFTDDFAIQNVAIALGVRSHPITQRKAKRVFWKYRCTGCGKYYDHDGECPVCGAAIKRKLK